MNDIRRWGWVLTTAMLLSVSAALATDSPMFRGGLGHSGAAEEIGNPPVLAWRWTGKTATPNNESAPAVVGNTIYFGAGTVFMAIDAENGAKKWQYPADAGIGGTFKTAPAVQNGIVYVGTGEGNLYALTADTGRLLWIASVRSPINSSPVVADGKVFFGANNGTLYAVDAKNGNMIYTKGAFQTSDYIHSSPIYNEGMVVLSSNDGYVYGVLASSAKAKWATRMPATTTDNSPILAAGRIYVGSGSNLFALNPSSGRTYWVKAFSSEVAQSPTANDNSVFVITNENKVYAFENTGKTLWKKPIILSYAPAASATVAGNMLIVPQRRGMISMYDIATGELKWQYTIRPLPSNAVNAAPRQDYVNITTSPVVANGTLYILTDNGELIAFSTLKGVDVTSPEVEYVLPEAGESMPGQPPLEITAKINDEGSGINPSTVKLFLDEEALSCDFDSTKGLISYKFLVSQTNKPWSDGRHNLRLEASDWAGNKLNKTWSVMVDNSLKRAAKRRYQGPTPGISTPGANPSNPYGRPGNTPNYPGR